MDARKFFIRISWLVTLLTVVIAAFVLILTFKAGAANGTIISPAITAICAVAFVFSRAVSGLLNGR